MISKQVAQSCHECMEKNLTLVSCYQTYPVSVIASRTALARHAARSMMVMP